MEKPPEPTFLSLEDVAQLLAVEYQFVYRLVRSGSLPAIRLGRIYRVARGDLEAYVESQRTAGEGAFTCAGCGRRYLSVLSRRANCATPGCGLPLCLDCVDRRSRLVCAAHDPSRSS